jgi:transketolase
MCVQAADTVQKANSGHPGAPMGLSPVAFALWTEVPPRMSLPTF